ncbi:serpentine receptor, putative [Plasmodium knowlesi strain H]|uniref:Serpentine receptor, putative n=3 Tax=Plasmodium knowlesi TaxID=5850 RepID=A0A5K1U5Z6_PLAKH|nr:serpentine receptor, putative [Plasmodium knowlesi strain H]OTN68029.1 putative Serpentine receptor [Plasmodium knowlesi]CAA9987033.1 serpentine receptor, putative [Plasmodium knowlesi strain H]SBO26712.1 serpentine receptor, putative [Plasmodium knowlesi strain H]SBO28238.1 serpentine receptor, putative [Plasmodium knowlesi strain H]VVS76507.1 serpentine receptor, putative [Plasmodium knowlesi strain H]|eukprot:XP_002258278.1 hypothetical protein, conserved in Plasmodium species [Plasmodium knowlesi strain H]
MAMPKGGFLTVLFFLLCIAHWDGGFPPPDRDCRQSCPKLCPTDGESYTWGIWPRSSVPMMNVKGRSIASGFYATGKVIYGLKEERNFSVYGDFCYSRSRHTMGRNGVLIVTSSYIPNTKLLILKKVEEDINNYMNGKNGNRCADLERKALFVHPFDNTPEGNLPNSYSLYEEDIGDNLKDTPLNFVLLACGRHVKNAYKIEFRNNAHFLRNHFSCEDQGLIEIHFLLVVILVVLSLAYKSRQDSLRGAHSAMKEGIHMSVMFFVLSNLCYLIHIFFYAFDGTGLTSLKVLSQMGESIYDCFVMTIIFYIMCCTMDREKRRKDTFRTALNYGVLKFLYLLVEMQNQEDLNLYASLHSVVALPFVLYRVIIAATIYRNYKRLLMEKTSREETFFISLHMFLYNLWILSIPAYYLLMSRASIHFTHLYVHFLNLLILIYLVHIISEKKYEVMESRHPYLDME